MYCTDCGTRNPNDSKFCRQCGRKILSFEDEARLSPSRPSKSLNIEVAEPPQEPEKLRLLLDMAFWHNEVGNIPGAVLACEAALKVDPYSTSALSLLGCLYEKQGNDAKAIEVFGRVVEINPDSIADVEKLEHLLRGIRDKAVTPSLVHQLTPPVLLQATRKYPNLPAVAALAVVLLFLLIGIRLVWGKLQFAPAVNSEPVSTVSTLNPSPRMDTPPAVVAPPSYSHTVQQSAGLPTPSTGVQADPFINQRVGVLSLPEQKDNAPLESAAPHKNPHESMDASATSMPSVTYIKPLVVPASAVPNHVVAVELPQSQNDHVVMVSPPAVQALSQVGQDANADSSSDLPPPPASHIYISVHGATESANNAGSTPLPADNPVHPISLRENAGASLQQKGLNLQQAGSYRAAEAAYESAIAAYQEDISNGRDADEAKRGIDACKVAVEICKQSQ